MLLFSDVKPRVEIERRFCPDVRRTSSYPDITKKAGRFLITYFTSFFERVL